MLFLESFSNLSIINAFRLNKGDPKQLEIFAILYFSFLLSLPDFSSKISAALHFQVSSRIKKCDVPHSVVRNRTLWYVTNLYRVWYITSTIDYVNNCDSHFREIDIRKIFFFHWKSFPKLNKLKFSSFTSTIIRTQKHLRITQVPNKYYLLLWFAGWSLCLN